jgi:hypothetical protein
MNQFQKNVERTFYIATFLSQSINTVDRHLLKLVIFRDNFAESTSERKVVNKNYKLDHLLKKMSSRVPINLFFCNTAVKFSLNQLN